MNDRDQLVRRLLQLLARDHNGLAYELCDTFEILKVEI